MQATMQADRQRMEAMAVEREAEQRRMAEILRYMQSLGAAMGVAPPPTLFAPPPPPPPHATTPVRMNVLVCMFMLTVKPQHYLEPSATLMVYIYLVSHATTHATLMVYIYLVSLTCNLFSFMQNQSVASNNVPHHLGGSPGSYVGPHQPGQSP
jgi:hypothetical protein